MDYDENEYQGENSHIGGEGSSKFSPIQHPYTLPKFDFDDGLQGHLRFDNLVQNEVFQEDNQWIEDFSRGSGDLVFNSSAPERNTNVWSEAASSESVEMLLNSVGQEVTVTIIEEKSDACEKLDSVANKMESHFNEDDKIINVMGSELTVIPEDNLDKGLEEGNLTEVDNSSLNNSDINNGMQDSIMHKADEEDSISQDIIVNSVIFDNQESVNVETNADSTSCLLADSVSKEIQVDDPNLKDNNFETSNEILTNISGSSSLAEIVELRQVEIPVSKLDEPNIFTGVESSELQMTDDCDKGVFASESDKDSSFKFVDSSNLSQINQLDENIQDELPEDFQGDGNIVEQVTEVSTEKFENSTDSEIKKYPTAEMNISLEEKKIVSQESACQLVPDVSVSNNQENIISNLGNNVYDSSVTSVCFSIQEGVQLSEKSNSGEDLLSPPNEPPLASNLNILHHDQVVCSNGEEKPECSNKSGEMENKVDENNDEESVGLSFIGESSEANNEEVRGSESDIVARIEPDVTVETPPLPYERGADDDLAANQIMENTNIEKLGSVETNLMPSNETIKITDKMNPVVEFEKDSAFNFTEKSVSEIKQIEVITNVAAGESSPVDGIINTEKLIKKAEKTDRISGNIFSKLELFPPMSYPTRDANHGDAGKDHKLASSEVSDSDVLTPTINHNVLNKNKSEKGKAVENSPVNSVTPDKSVEAGKSDVSKDSKSFTFEVPQSSGVVGKSDLDKQLFLNIQSFKSFKEASPLTPGISPMEPKTVPEPPRVISQAINLEIAHGVSINTPLVRKRGRPPGSVSKTAKKEKEISNNETTSSGRKRGRPSGKEKKTPSNETTPYLLSGKGENNKSGILTGSGKLQFEEVKLHDKFEKNSNIVPYAGIPVVTPNLPDLNTSASPSALNRQPFSEIQQMQLRAQIFVYGSLIQGAAPDETCMVAAFGTSDGGRSTWEPVWRAFVEKLQGVKLNLGKSETQLQIQSGSTPPEQPSTKKDPIQSSVLLPPVARTTSKNTPSPIINSNIPLSSPLWNISTPFQGLQSSSMPRSSVFDIQTPPSKNISNFNSPWPPHTSFPAPWSSQNSPFDPNSRIPTTETPKLTPFKELVPPIAAASGAKSSFPTTSRIVSVEPYSLPDIKNTILPSGQKTAEPKSRKRKKSIAPENIIHTPLFSQAQTVSVPAPVIPSHFSTSVVVSTPPLFKSKENDAKIVTTTTASPANLSEQPKILNPDLEKKSNFPEDGLIKIDEAKQQADEAANSAAAAVSHSQAVWEKLNNQNISGLKPEAEAKIASAAVAVAAAADVAKAAAAAARVASNAAFQLKMMADEAWMDNNNNNNNNNSSINKSISKSPILVAAKEAARKRVEATSFASKLAENLDAVIKAAELAASAASQVGTIVSMGDPPSLAKLVEFGPEGYWKKVPQVNEERANKGNIIQEIVNVSGDEPTKKKAKMSTSRGISSVTKDFFKDSMENYVKGVEGIPILFTSSEKNSRASELDKTIGVVPESESELRPFSINTQDEYNKKGMEISNGTRIREGCLVEVKKEGNGFKEAWFSANVLSMENGKAFVSYAGSRSGDGSTELKEWVALEGDGDNPPRIRIAQTDKQFDKTRKRRRGENDDFVCSIGDKVDVLMKECWREGVVKDMNRLDGTTLTVHFPAEGETSVVRVWHLRPTLIWKDGEWIESSHSRERDSLHKGDTPQEKRLKLGGPSSQGINKDNFSKPFQLLEPERPKELQLLPLSDKEKMFNLGTNIKKDSKLEASKTGRKEGSRVAFGVPKPGKKTKFMEVSKHFVAEGSNKTEKVREKYTMSKNDTKLKQQSEMKTMIPKPGKPISSFGRTLPQKDKFSNIPNKNESKKSASTDGSDSEQPKPKRGEFKSVSSSDGAGKGSFAFSSSAISKNTFKSNTRSDRAKRGNQTPIVGKKDNKIEAKENINAEKEVPEASEPRRSNRRIQPTSRMLEGLQSSLILPKFPSFAHDKGQRSHSRSTPKAK